MRSKISIIRIFFIFLALKKPATVNRNRLSFLKYLYESTMV